MPNFHLVDRYVEDIVLTESVSIIKLFFIITGGNQVQLFKQYNHQKLQTTSLNIFTYDSCDSASLMSIQFPLVPFLKYIAHT